MTPVWIEGWEHGVISVSGGGIVNSIVGTAPIVQSTIKRTGGYALKSAAAAGTSNCLKTLAASSYYLVGRFYFYVASGQWPSLQTCILYGNINPYPCIFLTAGATEKKVGLGYSSTLLQKSGVITEDAWHYVDFYFNGSANPWTINASVDGVPLTQGTAAYAAALMPGFCSGIYNTCTGTVYFDDLVLSQTSGDYPIGAGGVVGLSPNAAGTSNPGTYIQDNGSVVVNDATNPANVELDDVPFNGADYIKQTELDAALYAEVNFADTAQATIHGAQAFLAYSSEAVSANNGQTRIRDSNGQETTVFSGDMSETTMFYKSAIVLTPSGGWTMAHVNALTGRVGYSSDATPDPYWQGLMIQVAYVEGAGYTLACEGGSYTLTGQDLTPKRDGKIAAEAGSYALTDQVAGIYYGRAIDAEAGAYILTGAEAAALYGRAIDADAGAYVVTGTDAALLRAARLALDAGAYTITGQDAALIRAAKLVLDAGAYVLTGQAVTLTYVPGAGAYILSCESGTYAIAGQDAAALIDRLLSAGAGAYVIAGQDAALFRAAIANSILLYSRIKRTADLESRRAPSVDLQSEFRTEVRLHSRIDRD